MNEKQKSPEEIAKELGVPLIPKIQPEKKPLNPEGVISVCGQCGLKIKRVMLYVCTHRNCPVFISK